MYEVAFPITIMIAFLLTVVSIVAYEAYWEYREEKTKQMHINRIVKKAVETLWNTVEMLKPCLKLCGIKLTVCSQL